jgi:hypothetical protein
MMARLLCGQTSTTASRLGTKPAVAGEGHRLGNMRNSITSGGMFFLEVISVKFPVLFNVICVPFSRLGQSKTSFYVATTGYGSNPGAQTSRWRTIQHAADASRAGSIVNLRGCSIRYRRRLRSLT